MKYAIHLNFDKDTESVIRSCWKILYDKNLSKYMHESGNIPHIGIAHFNTHDIEKIINNINNRINTLNSFKISFDSFGFFKGPHFPVFLSPVCTKKLLETHDLIDNLIKDDVSDHTYRPDTLIYHCSLAFKYDIKYFPEIINEVKDFKMPVNGFVTGIRLIEIPTRSIYCRNI